MHYKYIYMRAESRESSWHACMTENRFIHMENISVRLTGDESRQLTVPTTFTTISVESRYYTFV